MSEVKKWDFYNPTAIHVETELAEALERHVEKRETVLFVTKGSTKRGLTAKVLAHHNCHVVDDIPSNPSFDDLRRIEKSCSGIKAEQLVAIGGGSVIDLAKVFSYAWGKGASIEGLLADLVAGKTLSVGENLPLIAFATTAGTGSEVTPFATVWDMQNRKKYSVGTANLYPKKAILIPALTVTLPWDVTLSTGLDALTQALESVWNKNWNPLTGSLARTAVEKIMRALPVLKAKPDDLEARREMLEGSLLSGLCISRTRTAMCHAASYPLTAHFGTPHGVACSFSIVDMWTHCLSADDGRMKQLSEGLGIAPEKFAATLAGFLESLDFASEFKKTITDAPSVLKLMPEMFTPGRADNAIAPFNSQSLEALIKKSLERWP
jgi:alcohol dehydrogenase